jgi:hypothetical protein
MKKLFVITGIVELDDVNPDAPDQLGMEEQFINAFDQEAYSVRVTHVSAHPLATALPAEFRQPELGQERR